MRIFLQCLWYLPYLVLLKAMLASESYLACLSMNHLFFKLIIKMQVFEHFLITGFISYAYCCHGNLHQQPKYITLRGNKYLRQIFSFRFLFFHPDIKIHLVSILSEGIFDKIFFLIKRKINFHEFFSVLWSIFLTPYTSNCCYIHTN